MKSNAKVAMARGLTIEDLHDSVGIHPTIAEDFVHANKLKLTDEDIPEKKSC